MKSKAEELRKMTPVQLRQKKEELAKELFKLENEKRVTRTLEKPHLVAAVKRERARVMTILNEKRGNDEQ